MKKTAILGATGSLGTQALDIAREFPQDITVTCLTAHTNYQYLARQANEFQPPVLALTGGNDADKDALGALLGYKPEIIIGKDALVRALMASNPDLVLLAVLGIAGLPAFAACLENDIDTAVANKESVVCGADVIRKMMDETAATVLPVDSEHSAIFQCLRDSYDVSGVNKIWITASGGPFLHMTKEEIDHAPLEKALKHPNWSMGQKITIDSASLANKGLEVMEAHYMFKAPADMIRVVIQPRSIVHAMVEKTDSSVIAQMSPVDMRLPLQKAMLYPKNCKFTVNKPLDFWKIGKIEFIEPDTERFPCLGLAYDAIENNTTAVYNIANEMAVDLYINGGVHFGGISGIIAGCMEKFASVRPADVKEILELDGDVRQYIRQRY